MVSFYKYFYTFLENLHFIHATSTGTVTFTFFALFAG